MVTEFCGETTISSESTVPNPLTVSINKLMNFLHGRVFGAHVAVSSKLSSPKKCPVQALALPFGVTHSHHFFFINPSAHLPLIDFFI